MTLFRSTWHCTYTHVRHRVDYCSPWKSVVERTVTNPRNHPFSRPFDTSFSVCAQFVEHYLCVYCSLCIIGLRILHSVISVLHFIEPGPFGPIFPIAIFPIAHHHGNIQVLKFEFIQVQWQMCFHFHQCSGSACMCQCPVVMLEVPILQMNHPAFLLPATVHLALHCHSACCYVSRCSRSFNQL